MLGGKQMAIGMATKIRVVQWWLDPRLAQQAMETRQAGWSLGEIGRHIGVVRQTIAVGLLALGAPVLNARGIRAQGVRQQIHELAAQGRSGPQIAVAVGLSRIRVWEVLSEGVKPRKGERGWTAKEDAVLGTMPDAQVARKLRRGVATVRRRRAMLGIAKWGRQGNPERT
mgnify:CR=1 FL=1